MFDTRQYYIINCSELALVDFDHVLETSSDSVRRSIDGTLTFIKWDGETELTFLSTLTTKQGPYSHAEILNILNTSSWTINNNLN